MVGPDVAGFPALPPHQIDIATNRALVVGLEETHYRQASFLDQRALGHSPQGQWFDLPAIGNATNASQGNAALHFIFHVGHCGSTLISRLLDELGAFGLREPLPLRSLAEIQPDVGQAWSLLDTDGFDRLAGMLGTLWSRRPSGANASVVKATSHTSGLATHMLDQRSNSRAVSIGLPFERYMATVLAGQYAPYEFRSTAGFRLRRLAHTGFGNLPAASAMELPQYAALAWLTETYTLRKAAHEAGSRWHHIDFDAFLEDPARHLAELSDHFGLGAEPERIEAAVNSPAMTRYSKAPEHDYSTGLRQQVIEQSVQQHGQAIREARNWAEGWISREHELSAMIPTLD